MREALCISEAAKRGPRPSVNRALWYPAGGGNSRAESLPGLALPDLTRRRRVRSFLRAFEIVELLHGIRIGRTKTRWRRTPCRPARSQYRHRDAAVSLGWTSRRFPETDLS